MPVLPPMSFFRYDGSVRNSLGFAQAGVSIGVYTQPASIPNLNAVGTPLATIWAATTSNAATITNIVWTNGFIIFTLSATPPADVVAGSYISVSSVNPSVYNAIWLVDHTDGNNSVYVASATNPGTYVSGGTVATSALPNPFLSDNLGNYFFYAVNTVPYTIQEFDPTYSRINPLVLVDQAVVAAGAGTGSVTSVAETGDGVIFNTTVTGSPITTSGTLVPALLTQTANRVLAGPTSGGAATPTFRALVAADLPSSGAGSGTVTSVAATIATDSFVSSSITGSPVTSTGTLAISAHFASQSANTFLCGPSSGGSAAPTFRIIGTSDLPASTAYLTSIQTWSAAQTFDSGDLILAGFTSGTTVLNAAAIAGTTTLTLPAVTDTVAVIGTAQTFSAEQTFGAGIEIESGFVLGWNDDTGISRTGAATLAIGNGTQADASGTLTLTTLTATGTVQGATLASTGAINAGTNKFTVNSSGVVTEYDSLTTAGLGVSPILTFAATTPTTPVSATNILTSAPAGLYRVSYYSVVTTTGVGGTDFKLNFIYTDAFGAQTIVAFTNSTFTAGNVNQGEFIVQNQSTGNIQYSITEDGSFSTHPILALQLSLSRIA